MVAASCDQMGRDGDPCMLWVTPESILAGMCHYEAYPSCRLANKVPYMAFRADIRGQEGPFRGLYLGHQTSEAIYDPSPPGWMVLNTQ